MARSFRNMSEGKYRISILGAGRARDGVGAAASREWGRGDIKRRPSRRQGPLLQVSGPNPSPASYHKAVFHSRNRLIVTRHLTIRGRVQGVWYRAWAVENARKLGLAGWVRNRRDGTVEAVVQGGAASVERFIELAREGSRGARVASVEAREWEQVHSEEFEQHPTV